MYVVHNFTIISDLAKIYSIPRAKYCIDMLFFSFFTSEAEFLVCVVQLVLCKTCISLSIPRGSYRMP